MDIDDEEDAAQLAVALDDGDHDDDDVDDEDDSGATGAAVLVDRTSAAVTFRRPTATSSAHAPAQPPPRPPRPRSSAPVTTPGALASTGIHGVWTKFLEHVRDVDGPVEDEGPARPPAPVQPKLLQHNVKRFKEALEPYRNAIHRLEAIHHWDQPYQTALTMVLYIYFMFYRAVFLWFVLVLLFLLLGEYLKTNGHFNAAEKKPTPEEEEAARLRDRKKGLRERFKHLMTVSFNGATVRHGAPL